MNTEGHWCGPDPCPECGETHGCICGNCDLAEEDFAEPNTPLCAGCGEPIHTIPATVWVGQKRFDYHHEDERSCYAPSIDEARERWEGVS